MTYRECEKSQKQTQDNLLTMDAHQTHKNGKTNKQLSTTYPQSFISPEGRTNWRDEMKSHAVLQTSP